MKCWLSVVVASLFSLPFVVGQSRVDDVSESGDSLRLARAVELTTDGVRELNLRGDVERAYQLFGEALASDSTYAPAQYSISQILLSSSPDSAILYSRSAYLSDTTNHWYLNRYAQSLISVGEYQAAREAFERLVVMRPLDLNAYRILAILYQQESKVDQAIALLDTAELRVGYNPYLMGMKREMLLSTNQSARAIEEAQRVVAERPFMADSRVAMAELYRDLGRDSLAVAEYDVAMQIDSTDIETLISYGEFFKMRGRSREYLSLLHKIVQSEALDMGYKLSKIKEMMADHNLYRREPMLFNSIITAMAIEYPQEREVVELRTQHLISMGMIEEALEVVKQHLDDEPPVINYYRMVMDMERYLERADSVLYYLDRAIARFPEERSLLMDKAYLYVMQGDYDASIEIFKENLVGATDSLQSSIWGTIGDVEHQRVVNSLAQDTVTVVTTRQMKRAMRSVYKYYDRALKASADNAMVLNNYAYFLCEYGGDLKRALEMSRRSNELESGNPTFIDTYAWILYRLGEYEQAKVEMRRAVSLDRNNNYEIALHYGEILAVLGEETMSELYWRRALEWGATQSMVGESRQRAEENKLNIE